MKFDIKYKEEERPIKAVFCKSKYDSTCGIYVGLSEIVFETNGISVIFTPQDAIELGEMLIKLGKQELGG